MNVSRKHYHKAGDIVFRQNYDNERKTQTHRTGFVVVKCNKETLKAMPALH